MGTRTRSGAYGLGLAFLVALATVIAGEYHYMPPGQRMEAESWPQLPPNAVKADPLAGGGKAVLLLRNGTGMSKTFKLARSHCALSVWVRAAQENTYLPPAYLELTVGPKTYRVRVRYNSDRGVYLPGYMHSFEIDKTAGYETNGDFAKAKHYIPRPDAPRDWRGENTRFYFPVDQAGDYTLTLRMGTRSQVDFLVDRVELRDVVRHLPAGPRKKQRVLFSDEELRAWQFSARTDPEAKALVERVKSLPSGLMRMSDEDLWAWVPSPYIPRAPKGGPDPVHGTENYRRGGMANPWGVGRKQWYVVSLVDKAQYPSNEFAAGDMTSGRYPDDGWGWFDAAGKSPAPDDRETWFIGRCAYVRWGQIFRGLDDLAWRYIVTGDPAVAHKAGVILAAAAYHYPGYDYRFQSRQTLCGHGRGGWAGDFGQTPPDSGIVQYNDWGCGKVFYCGWTGGPNNELLLMKSYDLLFPALVKDEALRAFVRKKAPWVKTLSDLQELFDRNLLAVHADTLIRRQAKSANSGWEASAATLGAIQGGPEAERILRELFTRASLDGTNSGGFEDAIVDMLCRDGVGLISSPMYMFGWAEGLKAAGNILSRIPDERLRKRYGTDNPKLMARYAAHARQALNILIAGDFLPNVGDTNRANMQEGSWFLRGVWPIWARIWKENRNPYYAALVLKWAPPDELLVQHADDVPLLRADAARIGGDLQQPSRILGGYGAAILEAGQGQPDAAKKGGVFLVYGPGWGHDHADQLNIELFAKGARLLPDKGRHHGGTKYHNVVQVDGKEQRDWADGSRFGWLNHFAAAPGIRFVDLGARPHNYGEVDRYRRAVAYVDAPGDDHYVFDVFQVSGSSQHVLGLHGPPACAFSSQPALGPPQAFAKAFYANGSFKNPREAAGPIVGPVVLDWQFLRPNARKLSEAKPTDIHFHATTWGAEGGTLASADVTGDIPFDLKGVHVMRRGKALASNFVTLIDPYEKRPFVRSATRLKATGKDADRAAALALTMVSGRRDLIVYDGGPAGRDTQLARMPAAPLSIDGGLELTGVFGFVSRDAAGKVRSALLVGGTRLKTRGLALAAARAEYRAAVVGVDYARGEIVLSEPLPTDMGLAGSVVVAGSPTRSRAYEIASLSPDGRKLRVRGSLLLYQSRIESVDADTGVAHVEFPMYFCRCDPHFYDGCIATNESHANFWRVQEVIRGSEKELWHHARMIRLAPVDETKRAGFAPPLTLNRAMFRDTDGDGRDLIYIYEIAPGDTVRITTWVYAGRGADGKMHVRGNVPCRLESD